MIKRLSSKEFQEIYSKVTRLCVDLVIKNNKGVLLTKRSIDPWKNLWHLPGGGIRFKESAITAAKRIAKEEVGLRINSLKFEGFLEYPIEKRRHNISLLLSARVPDSVNLKLNKESSEAEFFFNNFPEETIPLVKDFLKKYLKKC